MENHTTPFSFAAGGMCEATITSTNDSASVGPIVNDSTDHVSHDQQTLSSSGYLACAVYLAFLSKWTKTKSLTFTNSVVLISGAQQCSSSFRANLNHSHQQPDNLVPWRSVFCRLLISCRLLSANHTKRFFSFSSRWIWNDVVQVKCQYEKVLFKFRMS